MDIVIVCKNCGKERKHGALGLCKPCYDKQYRETRIIICKECNKPRRYHGNGLCYSCYNKKYYIGHKDSVLAKRKEYHWRNRDKFLIKKRAYNKKNRTEILKKAKEYRLRNQDKIKAYRQRPEIKRQNRETSKRYEKSLRGKFIIRKSKSKKRLILKGNIYAVGIPIRVQEKILQRDRGCVYCNKPYNGVTKEWAIDHIISISNQGNNNKNNLVLACKPCNSSKWKKDVFEWCKEQNIVVPRIVIELLERQKEQKKLIGHKFIAVNQKAYIGVIPPHITMADNNLAKWSKKTDSLTLLNLASNC